MCLEPFWHDGGIGGGGDSASIRKEKKLLAYSAIYKILNNC